MQVVNASTGEVQETDSVDPIESLGAECKRLGDIQSKAWRAYMDTPASVDAPEFWQLRDEAHRTFHAWLAAFEELKAATSAALEAANVMERALQADADEREEVEDLLDAIDNGLLDEEAEDESLEGDPSEEEHLPPVGTPAWHAYMWAESGTSPQEIAQEQAERADDLAAEYREGF